MTKTQKKQLESYKRSNKDRRQALLAKWGYATQEAYYTAMGGKTPAGKKSSKKSTTKKTSVKKVTKKETVHNVFIMDDSGSMSGAKYQNGVKGIQLLVDDIKKEGDTLVNNTISIVDLNRKTVNWMDKPEKVDYKPHTNLGGTPLYKTIGSTIDRILREKDPTDKVLLNITTDGQDTDGWGEYISLPEMLENVQKKHNFTVTFVGTEGDVKWVMNNLHVDKSNTLVHDNTGAGMTKSFNITRSARTVYAGATAAGLDTTLGFYKDLND